NSRLIAFDNQGITFKWKDYRIEGRDRYKRMTLATDEFIRRFLIHVLPKGLHRIRHYGLFAKSACADNIARARELLATAKPDGNPSAAAVDPAKPICPCCGGRMIIIEIFARGATPRNQPTGPATVIRIHTSSPRHTRANLPVTFAGSRPATAEHGQISVSRHKSSDNLSTSTPPVTHSSAALPSHTSLHQLDSNQPARPRHSNPHSACGTAPRDLKRGFLPWRLSDAGRRTCRAVPQAAGIRNPTQNAKNSR